MHRSRVDSLPDPLQNSTRGPHATAAQPARAPSLPTPTPLTLIESALDQISADAFVEVREDGEWLAEFMQGSCAVRGDGQYPTLHLRYGEHHIVRRIVRIAAQSPENLSLDVMRFGQTKPGRLEFVRTDARKPRNRVQAELFRRRLARLLAENFPDSVVSGLTSSQDPARYFSSLYVRGIITESASTWALFAVPPGSNLAPVHGALMFALAWLAWIRDHSHVPVSGLRMFVPYEAVSELQHQARWLHSRAQIQIFAIDENSDQIEPQDHADVGNVKSELIPRWEIERLLGRGKPAIDRIRSMAPNSIEHVAAGIELETDDVPLRFRGLEFARWTNGYLQLDPKRRASPSSPCTLPPHLDPDESLRSTLSELALRRNPLATDTRHPFYRSAPESWLESLILADPLRLDATLDTRFLYSQVPAFAHSHQGVMDLIGVTRRGRLVVIELKVSEEIQLLMQGLRYWMRVKQHLDDGDFTRGGYFPGIQLDSKPPLLWLVAPSLRFHPALDLALKYLSPQVEVTRIGINENWRRGIRVAFRQ